jgi:hypothetical protein
MMLDDLLAVRAGLNFRSVGLLVRNPGYGKLFEWTVFLPVRKAVASRQPDARKAMDL